jgi:hypothetical protein
MAGFHVYIDKRDIKDDGSIYIEIDDWDISDACADNGGCCDSKYHDGAMLVDFKEKLDHYYFQNSLEQDELYREILAMAGEY